MSTPLPRRPMTDLEKQAAIALGHCGFTPASFDKRFAREISFVAQNTGEATERMIACLWRKCWRYRRQIQDRAVLAEAEKWKDAPPAWEKPDHKPADYEEHHAGDDEDCPPEPIQEPYPETQKELFA